MIEQMCSDTHSITLISFVIYLLWFKFSCTIQQKLVIF